MVSISWLLVITILAAALAIFDGVRRLRGHHSNSILAIAELISAGLLLISSFVTLPFGTLIFAIILLVVLILLIMLPGKAGKGYSTYTLIALILTAIVVLTKLGWLSIPGLT